MRADQMLCEEFISDSEMQNVDYRKTKMKKYVKSNI